jgi:hypothetical protein
MDLSGDRVPGKADLLIGMENDRSAVRGRLPFTAPNRNHGRVGIWIHVKAVIAGFRNGKRLVGRINFPDFVVIEAAHVQNHRALVQLQLD